jgi:hypothetical protein
MSRLHALPILLAFTAPACHETPKAAEYGRCDRDWGEIIAPDGSPANRAKAEALMRKHFPEGYVVVSEGEEYHEEPASAWRIVSYDKEDDAPIIHDDKYKLGLDRVKGVHSGTRYRILYHRAGTPPRQNAGPQSLFPGWSEERPRATPAARL